MRSTIRWIISALLAAAAPLATAQEPVLVGAIVSQSGAHAAEAAEYRKGLVLWQEQANAAGGLAGRRIELRIVDDGSEGVRAGRVAAELIAAGAQVLIGPYGSAATLAVAAEAERAGRVLLNAAGASSQAHKRQPRYVFQVVASYAAYAEGPLALARDAGARSLLILGRDDAGSREMAEAAFALAQRLGFAAELDIYGGGTEDFGPHVQRASASRHDGWIAFGQVRDAADMVKALKRQGFSPRFFHARSSTDPRFIELVGQDAERTVGSLAYAPSFPTPGNAAFVQAFRARWSQPPGTLAAQAYAAGTVLAEAARRAGTLEPQKLRAALAALEAGTVLGLYRVDAASGLQVGVVPAAVQVVEGRTLPLWPPPVAAEAKLLPFVPWNEREVRR